MWADAGTWAQHCMSSKFQSSFCRPMAEKVPMLRLDPLSEKNMLAFENLSQHYEAEFSSLTRKEPDSSGRYAITSAKKVDWGYLCFDATDIPVGFLLCKIYGEIFDVAEFYVIPTRRRAGVGKWMAQQMFDLHPGRWQVKQISGADRAYDFWMNMISEYTAGKFENTMEPSPMWGSVRVQRFSSR